MSRILIIEDEESIAELEKDYLELSGFEVIIEEDGLKGLEMALSGEIDLLILDLMLPGINGFDICFFLFISASSYSYFFLFIICSFL